MEEQGVNVENNAKAGSVKLAAKIALVALIFAVAFYLIYFTTQYRKVVFILSNQEIASIEDKQVVRYTVGDKIHFFIKRNFENLDSNMFAMEIEYFENNDFKRYKQISYEIDKNFADMGAYIPTVYFMRPGRYHIKASLDGKVVATNEIELVER